METNNNDRSKQPDSDKTRIYSNVSSSGTPNTDDKTRVSSNETGQPFSNQQRAPEDATQISSGPSIDGKPQNTTMPDATQISSGPSNQVKSQNSTTPDTSSQNKPTAEELHKLKDESKNRVSTGAFVAGMGGAALAGVAAGAVFSEDIKGVFTPPVSDNPESPDSEITEAIPEMVPGNTNDLTNETTSSSTTTSLSMDASDAIAGAENEVVSMDSSIQVSFTDQTGHYEVNCIDLDSDGVMDSLTSEAQLVDGSSMTFSASGQALHSLLNNYEIAGVPDFVSEGPEMGCCLGEFPDAEDTGFVSYQIQPGDTLSEIAKENHTTIVRLLDLNPQITDANLIYAGHQITIPTDDTASNPYDGWNPGYNTTSPPDEPYTVETTSDESGQYATMDWGSFEDSPVEEYGGSDEYSSLLASSNFDDYSTPDSYFSSDNNLSSMDFM